MKTFILIFGFLSIGCTSLNRQAEIFADKVEQIQPGTSLEQVKSEFGRPSEYSDDKNNLVYSKREFKCVLRFENSLLKEKPTCTADQNLKVELARKDRDAAAESLGRFGSFERMSDRPVLNNCSIKSVDGATISRCY